MNDIFALNAISPLDGRYAKQLTELGSYVSEAALIRYRVQVEAQWLLFLSENVHLSKRINLSKSSVSKLKDFIHVGGQIRAEAVKKIEKTTNHDVKAVEYYLRDELISVGATSGQLAFLHFACTSEDINNLSYAFMTRDVRKKVLLPELDEIYAELANKAKSYADIAMLSRTHGQSASPTTMGKEFGVFAQRLLRARDAFAAVAILGKINGAVGNYNAHAIAFPEIDWPKLCQDFVENRLEFGFNPMTTQIENHDALSEYLASLRLCNSILLDLCRDVWSYISLGYLGQKKKVGEVGSSTMPHKINPIDFENAEGNLGISNAMIEHLCAKLPVSRLQRDLSDSTVLRNIGVIAGYSVLAYRSCLKGLNKITINEDRIQKDLNSSWEVLAEAVQTVMRAYGIDDAYEQLKELTRGNSIDEASLHAFIKAQLSLPEDVKNRLIDLSPAKYIGYARSLAKELPRINR